MSPLEYRLSALVLGLIALACRLVPVRRDRVVLATARLPLLEGNLLHIRDALRGRHPGADVVLLLQPYSYGLRGKIRYLLRMLRATFIVHTSGLVVVDNAYLPVHVLPHRPAVTVVQVWHAAGALKRFGADSRGGLREPEATFLHRYYDAVVTSGEASREPWSRALRTPVERVLALGTPRTDSLFDPAALASARERVLAANPVLAGRRIVLYAPTFRGRGRHKRGIAVLDAARLRARLPETFVLVLKGHPNVDPGTQPSAGYDVVADPGSDMNDWLAAADVFVTDYSSSVFEWALLRRPLVLVAGDLEAYERDPGLYLDYWTEMIGARVSDADGAADAILGGGVDPGAWDAFIARNLGACDGHASERFVEHFVTRRTSSPSPSPPPQGRPPYGRGSTPCVAGASPRGP